MRYPVFALICGVIAGSAQAQPILPGLTDPVPFGEPLADIPDLRADQIRAYGQDGIYPFPPLSSRECSTLAAGVVENRADPRRRQMPFNPPPLLTRSYHLPGDCIRRNVQASRSSDTRDSYVSVLTQDSVGMANPDLAARLFSRVVIPRADWLRYLEEMERAAGATAFGEHSVFRLAHGLTLMGQCQLLPFDLNAPSVRCSLSASLFLAPQHAFATARRSWVCTTRRPPEAHSLNEVAQGLNQFFYSANSLQAANSYLQRMGEDCVAPFLRETFSQATTLIHQLAHEREHPNSRYHSDLASGMALGGLNSPTWFASRNTRPLGAVPLSWTWNAVAVEHLVFGR